MLWYGYIYYMSFFVMLLLMVLFFIRSFNVLNVFRLNVGITISRLFMSNVLFLLFVTFVVLNNLMQFYQDLVYVSNLALGLNLSSISAVSSLGCFNITASSISLIEVYYYPFIYVFLIVTVLSIVFCLSYNKDELMSFMFYCQLILLAGYALFFTDSIILFFLAYEMLLVPSFFILYKFAKTRRCVEAAYLMFFWTQFGALFLIFALIYLFLICNSSKFSIISYYYFTSFEVNFMFTC